MKTRMSRFEGFSKVFIKFNTTKSVFTKKAEILNGKATTYPEHFSAMILFTKKYSVVEDYIKSPAFQDDIGEWDTGVTHGYRFEILGHSPDCFCLVFEADVENLLEFRTRVCETLKTKCKLKETEQCDYINLYDFEELVVKIPIIKSTKFHITLFSSFDLRRCNKKKYKEYSKASSKLDFMKNEVDEFWKEEGFELCLENRVNVT